MSRSLFLYFSLCTLLARIGSGELSGAEPSLLASPYRIDQWKVEQGLPQNTVQCLLQTRDGYLWIGTRFGLVRYDGLKFTLYTRANTPALASENCLCLAEDNDGCLWIGTPEGLVRRDRRAWSRVTTQDGLSANQVDSLLNSRRNGLWAGTPNGLHRLRAGRWESFLPQTPDLVVPTGSPPDNGAHCLKEDAAGRVWFRNAGGLQHFDPRTGKFTLVAAQGLVHSLSFDHTGGLWWCNEADLHFLPAGQTTNWTTVWRQPGNPMAFVYGDQAGALWVKTARDGLTQWVEGRLQPLPLPAYLNEQRPFCMLEDREGNYWVGTELGGLFRLQPRRITVYTTREGMAGNDIRSVCLAPDGSIWASTDLGLSHFTGAGFRNYAPFGSEPYRQQAHVILADSTGELWGATGSTIQGLSRFDFAAGGFARVLPPPNGAVITVSSLYQGPDGLVWAGTDVGVYVRQKGQWRLLPDSPRNVRAMLQDRAGHLWLGTIGEGVYRWDKERFVQYTVQDGLPGPNLWVLHEDAQGTLWLGGDKGLVRYKNGRFVALTTRQGLYDNLVNQLFEDEQGRFWLGCNRGIFRVARADLEALADGRTSAVTCVVYGEADGMVSSETNGESQPAGAKDRAGRLWFPTTRGLVVIDPRTVQDNTNPPPVVIEQVLANGQAVVGEVADLVFAPGTARVVEIRYTANSFAAPEKVRFKCRLEGYDETWRDMEDRRIATYTNLRPGRYRFRVIACNNHGLWNPTGATFQFRLQPFFYQTQSFFAVCGLVALGTGWYLHRRRIRFTERLQRLEQQHALDRERARIAHDIHDDLGSRLSQLSVLGELTERHLDPRTPARPHLAKLRRTTGEIFQAMDEIVWAVNPKQDSLAGLVSYLREFGPELLGPAGILCRLDFPNPVPDCPLPAHVRHHLFLVVKEALQNILKHAQATEVRLGLALEERTLTLRIEDNGRGFELPAPGSGSASAAEASLGNGLSNMRNRIAQLGGQFHLQSLPTQGTCIMLQVTLPR